MAVIVVGVIVLGGVSAVAAASVITEISVAIGTTAINHLTAATAPIAALNHPSRHNIYCVHYGEKIPGKSVLVTVHSI